LLLSSLMLRSSSAASAWCGGGPFGRAKSVAVMLATHFFVALACIPDLLKCAKHLFVAAIGGLRRRIEALLLPDDVDVRLVLDRATRLERDQRRRGGEGRMGDYGR
jgi:hypothetical protein